MIRITEREFTQNEKHEIYKRALELFQEYGEAVDAYVIGVMNRGLCNVIILAISEIHGDLVIPKEWYSIRFGGLVATNVTQLFEDNRFPEFVNKCPPSRSINEFWWPYHDIETRTRVLKELIEETKPSIL